MIKKFVTDEPVYIVKYVPFDEEENYYELVSELGYVTRIINEKNIVVDYNVYNVEEVYKTKEEADSSIKKMRNL
jgi:hypothetical protein